jgi:hypothetical protein
MVRLVTSTEPVFVCDAGTARCEPAAIDLGFAKDQVYLILFGTGIRRNSSLNEVSVTIGGASVPVEYAGPQGEFVGLDQVNVRLSSELEARGTVDVVLTVTSNCMVGISLDAEETEQDHSGGPKAGRHLEDLNDRRCMSRPATPVTATLEGGRRIEKPTFPPKVLREATVNALIHRDYLFSGTDIELVVYCRL